MFSSMYLRYQQMRKKLHCHYLSIQISGFKKKIINGLFFFNDYKYL